MSVEEAIEGAQEDAFVGEKPEVDTEGDLIATVNELRIAFHDLRTMHSDLRTRYDALVERTRKVGLSTR